MNDNLDLDNTGDVSGNDVLLADETNVTEETEQTDTQTEVDVSATESLTVADTPTSECLFTDTNIIAKMDIIITLLLVMIALKMFSPLANNYKRGLQKKEK